MSVFLTFAAHAVQTPLVTANPPRADQKIVIPAELGEIEESFQGSSGKTIIYIQDAHDSLEAQENIAKLILYFVVKYHIKTVFEEGYEGPVPTDDYFGFIKKSATKEKVSYFLMDKLRIGGAEYAHINRTKDFKLTGVEDLKLYSKNIKSYQKSSRNRKKTKKDLDELFSQVALLANLYFPKDFKIWLKYKEDFRENKQSLLVYLQILRSFYLKVMKEYPQARLPGTFPAISMLLNAQTSQDRRLVDQLNALDSEVIFEEILRMEQDVSNAVLKNARDRKIFAYYQGLILLKKLNQIELTLPEFEAVKETLQGLETQKIADFIVSLTHRSLVLSKSWEQNIQDAIEFYSVAQSRDQAMNSHIKNFLLSPNEGIGVLVFGGFHSTRIKEILRQQRISYYVITPKITSVDKKHQDIYKQLMSTGYHSFETLFLMTHANKPPSTFFIATLIGDDSVRNQLRAIASSVETIGDNAAISMIEDRLKSFKPGPVFPVENVQSGIRSEMRVPADDSDIHSRLKRVRGLVGEKKYPEAAKIAEPLADELKSLVTQKSFTETDPFLLANYYAALLLKKVAQKPEYFFSDAALEDNIQKSIQILIFDSKGRVLLQTRGPFKRLFASKYTVSANAKRGREEDEGVIKQKISEAITAEVGIIPDHDRIIQVGKSYSYTHYLQSYAFQAFDGNEAKLLRQVYQQYAAHNDITMDYDFAKHSLTIYGTRQDKRLSEKLYYLVKRIKKETRIPSSPKAENLEKSSLFVYVLNPDEEERIGKEIIPRKVETKNQARRDRNPLTESALKAIDSDDMEFAYWRDVAYRFGKRHADFAEDLIASYLNDPNTVREVEEKTALNNSGYILHLDDPRAGDPVISGGKGSNLHILRILSQEEDTVNVPEGAVVSSRLFQDIVLGNPDLKPKIEALNKLSFETGAEKNQEIPKLSEEIRKGIMALELPENVVREVPQLIEYLGGDIAVRSSASVEDSANAAAAGKARSFLHQKSPDEVEASIKGVWASLFDDGFVAYRVANGMKEIPTMSVVLLKMIPAKAAGTLFSVDSRTGRPVFVIEANFGLGESVVSGKVSPDRWIVAPDASLILEKTISRKELMITQGTDGTLQRDVRPELQNVASLDDEQVLRVARTALKIQQKYAKKGTPHIDTEFALDQNGIVFIVQTRPETTVKNGGLSIEIETVDEEKLDKNIKVIPLTTPSSITAVNGVATGRLIVRPLPKGIEDSEIQKRINKIVENLRAGDILVTVATDAKWDLAFARVAGVITDQGGWTSHAAVTAREKHIPGLVSSENATQLLAPYDGQTVTFDSYRRSVYITGKPAIKTIQSDIEMWRSADELLKDPDRPKKTVWKTSEEHIEFNRGLDNFMEDFEGVWRGRPKTPYGYLELEYYARAFERYTENLNRLFPDIQPRFKTMPWKFKDRIVYTSMLEETDSLHNVLYQLTPDDFDAIFKKRVEAFRKAESFFPRLKDLDAENIEQVMELLIELLSWMHVARPFHYVYEEKFIFPQIRLINEEARTSKGSSMELAALSKAADKDAHWLNKLTHWDKVKEMTAIEELIRSDPEANHLLMTDPGNFSTQRPELYKRIESFARTWRHTNEDIRKGDDVEAFVQMFRGNIKAELELSKTVSHQQLLRLLDKYDLENKNLFPTLREENEDLYLATRFYGKVLQAKAKNPVVDEATVMERALAMLKKEKTQENKDRDFFNLIFDQYPTLRHMFSIIVQSFSFMEDAHQLITRYQKQLYPLLMEAAEQHKEVFGNDPVLIFDLSTDEVVALFRDKSTSYLERTFERRRIAEAADKALEQEWRINSAQALKNYKETIVQVTAILNAQAQSAEYPEVKGYYGKEIRKIENRIKRLEVLSQEKSGGKAVKTARSEMRKVNEGFQSTVAQTIHLQSEAVFTIRSETLENLARSKKSGGYDQWLELLGLKMLNEDKLHIVIDSKEEQALSDRISELLLNHKKVYLGWGPRTLASLPKNAPVIQFEKVMNGQLNAELLKGRPLHKISAIFDIFDGAFVAAFRYVQNPSRLEELTRQNHRVITSATALDLGLLDQLFKTYAIISQAA